MHITDHAMTLKIGNLALATARFVADERPSPEPDEMPSRCGPGRGS